jgi:hypothetical protein
MSPDLIQPDPVEDLDSLLGGLNSLNEKFGHVMHSNDFSLEKKHTQDNPQEWILDTYEISTEEWTLILRGLAATNDEIQTTVQIILGSLDLYIFHALQNIRPTEIDINHIAGPFQGYELPKKIPVFTNLLEAIDRCEVEKVKLLGICKGLFGSKAPEAPEPIENVNTSDQQHPIGDLVTFGLKIALNSPLKKALRFISKEIPRGTREEIESFCSQSSNAFKRLCKADQEYVLYEYYQNHFFRACGFDAGGYCAEPELETLAWAFEQCPEDYRLAMLSYENHKPLDNFLRTGKGKIHIQHFLNLYHDSGAQLPSAIPSSHILYKILSNTNSEKSK